MEYDLEGYEEKPKGHMYGHTDWVLPAILGALVVGSLSVAMLTFGPRAMLVNTFVAFILVGIWLFCGVFIGMGIPFLVFMEGIRARRVHWMIPFFGSIGLGLAYFVVSGVFMAHTSLPIQ
ncbi:MAG TPA: hypothetical protein VIQ80_02135 [Candidatus Saccharimonadales bacterium]